MSRLRDIESALFGLFEIYNHSGMYLHVDASTRRKYNPYKAFSRSYFDERADAFVEDLLTFFETEMDKRPVKKTQAYSMWFSEMGSWLQSFIIKGLMPIYNQTEASRNFALPYGQNEFERQSGLYLT